MHSFRRRSSETELMDRPDADEAKLLRTVRQFRSINLLFSRSRALLQRHVIAPIAAKQPAHVSFLDIGAGGCEIAAWLAQRVRRMGIEIDVYCLDSDPRIARMARRRYRELAELHVISGSIDDLPDDFRVDYAFSNHTLHHLSDAEIEALFRWLSQRVDRAFLMNDLMRSRFWHAMYTVAAGLLFHDTFSFTDGRISIRRGFRADELRRLADCAGLPAGQFRTEVRNVMPGRVVVVGKREQNR